MWMLEPCLVAFKEPSHHLPAIDLKMEMQSPIHDSVYPRLHDRKRSFRLLEVLQEQGRSSLLRCRLTSHNLDDHSEEYLHDQETTLVFSQCAVRRPKQSIAKDSFNSLHISNGMGFMGFPVSFLLTMIRCLGINAGQGLRLKVGQTTIFFFSHAFLSLE